MDLGNARRLIDQIPGAAKVVDVGGGASPFPRADYVIDSVPFDARGTGSAGNIHQLLNAPIRYSPETWIQLDVCNRQPWPFDDKTFDFAICSHLLEDLRDPIWVCSELRRIAKAGYIEVPSRIEEQTLGVEHPRYAGYYHHRWIITLEGSRLDFRHKPHSLHSMNDAIVTRLQPGWRINPRHAILTFQWQGDFEFREVLESCEERVNDELCSFAHGARCIRDLAVPVPMALTDKIRRYVYYWRLRRGAR
jgi:Methyltransferase domain